MKKGKMYEKLLERRVNSAARLEKFTSRAAALQDKLSKAEDLERTTEIRKVIRNTRDKLMLTKCSIMQEKSNYNKILQELKKYED